MCRKLRSHKQTWPLRAQQQRRLELHAGSASLSRAFERNIIKFLNSLTRARIVALCAGSSDRTSRPGLYARNSSAGWKNKTGKRHEPSFIHEPQSLQASVRSEEGGAPADSRSVEDKAVRLCAREGFVKSEGLAGQDGVSRSVIHPSVAGRLETAACRASESRARGEKRAGGEGE